MTNVGQYTPLKNPSTKFVVKNIAPGNKRVRVFQYPINNGATRDLLAIPGISEADIRHSLLKGEVLQKLKSQEIIVVDSDIDLLQFNADQMLFLQQSGITQGLQVTGATPLYAYLQDVPLLGLQDGVNTVFTTPDIFIYNTDYKLTLYLNGVRQEFVENFIIAEGGGPGTGYDTIIFVLDAPAVEDILVVDYYKA